MARLLRTVLAASSVALAAAACAGTSSAGGGNASCVGPFLDDQPPGGAFRGPMPTVRPGGTIVVHGHWYTDTCNDTGQHDPLAPLPPVHLTVRWPDGAVLDLGSFRPAGRDMGFSTEVHVPADVAAGRATVSDHRDPGATFAFRVRG